MIMVPDHSFFYEYYVGEIKKGWPLKIELLKQTNVPLLIVRTLIQPKLAYSINIVVYYQFLYN